MTIKEQQEAVFMFHEALVTIQAQTVRRLLQMEMPEYIMPICTGSDDRTVEYIIADLEGRLEVPDDIDED